MRIDKYKMEVNLSAVIERKWAEVGNILGGHIVKELSKKYKFDGAEALEHLKLNVKVVEERGKKDTNTKKKTSIPLPFCFTINETTCHAIRLNHGLYTQCTNLHSEENGENPVCSTCKRQLEKNSNGAPTYGYVTERMNMGETFRDPKGKSPVNYGNIMEKLKISRSEAEREATNQGVTIPENQFEVKKSQRGRPKKDTTAVDTSGSEEEIVQPEKQRGRPKKEKKVVSSNTGDDMINDLVNKVNEKTPDLEPEPEVAESDDDDEQVEVTKITIKGIVYLKAATGMLYNPTTWEELGKWNEETNEIESVDTDED